MVRTTDRHAPKDDDRFAEEYAESRSPIDVDDLQMTRHAGLSLTGDRTLSTQSAVDFEYTTPHGNTKTVRCYQGTPASDRDVERGAPADGVTFWHDGDGYAADLDTGALYKRTDNHEYRKVPNGDDVDAYRVDLPEAAPVVGAVQDGVDVTVHYRSNRNGNMKTVTLRDVDVEWEGDRVRGEDTRRDRKLEVEAVFGRSVTSKSFKGGDREVGKVARIEFPAGHRYTVDAHGVTDAHAGNVRDAIEQAVESKVGGNDVDVDVRHDGRIDD